MNKATRIAITLPAILFIFMGLRWLVMPEAAATAQAMALLQGLGLSSQIGDIGALFLGMGSMIFLGQILQQKAWLQAPALLLLMVAFYRLCAWLFHDASFAPKEILVEVIVASLLIYAAGKMDDKIGDKA